MKGIKRLTASSYEIDDFIAIVADDHIFGGKDLANGRGEEALGNITDDDQRKLLMPDEQINNFSAIGKLPQFRSKVTKQENLKTLHRRKYKFDGAVKLKDNAQVK